MNSNHLIKTVSITAWTIATACPLRTASAETKDPGPKTDRDAAALSDEQRPATVFLARAGDERPRTRLGPFDRSRGSRRPSAWRGLDGDFVEGNPTIEDLLAFVQEHFPIRYEQLNTLRESDAEGFVRRIRQMAPRIGRMRELFERNPENAQLMVREQKLGFEIQRRVDHYFEAGETLQREELRDEIRSLVEERLGVQHKLRELEVERLERRLRAVKKTLDRDRDRRDQQVEYTLEDLGVFDDE